MYFRAMSLPHSVNPDDYGDVADLIGAVVRGVLAETGEQSRENWDAPRVLPHEQTKDFGILPV
ncbi:hypothetical protein [Acidithiobacillus ferrianus]|uniref:hypothetical protein n=1 Tax=Acidithiobacillus ferrianus TaxID=2678518 RepID=UPI0034E4D13F